MSNYREAFGSYACIGILLNHESPLRPHRFVTLKIVQAAKRTASGSPEKLVLGPIDISRHWGRAPNYLDAMWLLLQQDKPEDNVIAIGHTFSLQEFVETAFELLHLDWRDHVLQDDELFRPSDILISSADSGKLKRNLDWRANWHGRAIVEGMMHDQP